MKKLTYEGLACAVAAEDGWTLRGEIPGGFCRDSIAYAAERFFARSPRLCRRCTYESWQLRVAHGRARRPQRFSYIVPAALLELPGAWVRLTGEIDPAGVRIRGIDLLRDYPGTERKLPSGRSA